MITNDKLLLCAKLSMLAYEDANTIDFTTLNLDLLQIINNDKTGTQGFIVGDATNKILYIVFRGTDQFTDIEVDLRFQQVPLSANCGNGYVHNGFLEAFNSVKNQIFQPSFKKYNDWDVIITGHSLGGALATITGAIGTFTQKVSVITFGSPKVGDVEFVRSFNKCKMDSIRVVHEADPVPELPPFPHYCHVDTLLRIDSDGNILKDYGFFIRIFKTIKCWITEKSANKSDEIIDFHDHKKNTYISSIQKLCAKDSNIFSRLFSK